MAAILADDIFKGIFVNEKVRFFNKIFAKVVPKGLIDGLAQNRRQQTIILTNADPILWRFYVTLGGDELNFFAVETVFPQCGWDCKILYHVYCLEITHQYSKIIPAYS